MGDLRVNNHRHDITPTGKRPKNDKTPSITISLMGAVNDAKCIRKGVIKPLEGREITVFSKPPLGGIKIKLPLAPRNRAS